MTVTSLKPAMSDLLQMSAAEFIDSTIPKSVELTVKNAPRTIKRFDPKDWNQAIQLLREMLHGNRIPYVAFQYRPEPRVNEVKNAYGNVTKQNIAKLPRLLNRAWSEIKIYDLLEM